MDLVVFQIKMKAASEAYLRPAEDATLLIFVSVLCGFVVVVVVVVVCSFLGSLFLLVSCCCFLLLLFHFFSF